MKALWNFIKAYWKLPAILIGIFLLVTITIQVFSTEPCPSEWSLIQCIATQLAKYLQDWALIFSALAMIMLAFAAFWTISDTRHFRSLESKRKSAEKVSKWAKRALDLLSLTKQVEQEVYRVVTEFMTIADDASYVGKDLETRALIAVSLLVPWANKIMARNKPSKDETTALVNSLNDVVASCTAAQKSIGITSEVK